MCRVGKTLIEPVIAQIPAFSIYGIWLSALILSFDRQLFTEGLLKTLCRCPFFEIMLCSTNGRFPLKLLIKFQKRSIP